MEGPCLPRAPEQRFAAQPLLKHLCRFVLGHKPLVTQGPSFYKLTLRQILHFD